MCTALDTVIPYVTRIRAHAGLDAVLADPVTELSERKRTEGPDRPCLGARSVAAGEAADSFHGPRTAVGAGALGEGDRTRDVVGVEVEAATGTTNATTMIETGIETSTAGIAITRGRAPGLDRVLGRGLARDLTPGRGPAPALAPRRRKRRESPGHERSPPRRSYRKLLQLLQRR